MEDTRMAFERAARGVEGGEPALQAMTNAYVRLVSECPEALQMQMQMQMQGYVVVAAAEGRGMARSANWSGPAG